MENKIEYIFDIAQIISSSIWPIIVLIIVIILRKNIPNIITSLSKRVKKLSFAGVTLEMSSAEGYEPNLILPNTNIDLRNSLQSMYVNDSYSGNILEMLQSNSSGDYVIINLDNGRGWFMSRLFILAILFEKYKGTQAIVFTDKSYENKNKYIGYATPESIKWSIAMEYPWLERAFSNVYNNLLINNYGILDQRGRLGEKNTSANDSTLLTLLSNFLNEIQHNVPTIPDDQDKWVEVSSAGTIFYEHTDWLTESKLYNILGNSLCRDYIKIDSIKSGFELSEKTIEPLLSKTQYLATIDYDGNFLNLLHKSKLTSNYLKTVMQENR